MNFKGNIGELENQALEISQNKAHRVEIFQTRVQRLFS